MVVVLEESGVTAGIAGVIMIGLIVEVAGLATIEGNEVTAGIAGVSMMELIVVVVVLATIEGTGVTAGIAGRTMGVSTGLSRVTSICDSSTTANCMQITLFRFNVRYTMTQYENPHTDAASAPALSNEADVSSPARRVR